MTNNLFKNKNIWQWDEELGIKSVREKEEQKDR